MNQLEVELLELQATLKAYKWFEKKLSDFRYNEYLLEDFVEDIQRDIIKQEEKIFDFRLENNLGDDD